MCTSLRGSAPLQRAVLQHDKFVGVTLQTLDLKHFDHGAIIDQTPRPGLKMPSLGENPLDELVSLLGSLGAEMLGKNIVSGNFLNSRPIQIPKEGDSEPRHAPKITTEDKHIQWNSWSVKDFLVRDRVLGHLWDTEASKHLFNTKSASSPAPRIVYSCWGEVLMDDIHGETKSRRQEHDPALTNGVPFVRLHDPEKRLIFKCKDGFVAPNHLTIEGKPKTPASKFWQDVVNA